MSSQIQADHFTKALHALLDETFDNVHGFFLDKGTSMFETLATISAEEASIPVGGKCATLAAQVKHVAFYLVLQRKIALLRKFAADREGLGVTLTGESIIGGHRRESKKQTLKSSCSAKAARQWAPAGVSTHSSGCCHQRRRTAGFSSAVSGFVRAA
jgi:hypothetical protein